MSQELIPIKKGLKDLEIVMVGTPKQFIVSQGETFCARDGCEGCPYDNNGCSYEESELESSLIPNARRGIGYEDRSFLVLKFKEGKSIADLPEELKTNPYDNLCLNPYNLHFLLWDDTKPFRIIKGQIRYYGDMQEFFSSDYCTFFDVVTKYRPKHKVFALDYSAIEPRVSTMVCREPQWLEVFRGKSKTIVNKVKFSKKGKSDE